MRKTLLLVATTAALLALSSCAPAALGGASNNPYPAAGGTPSLRTGETIYVRVDYSLDELGLAPEDLRPTMWVPSGYDSELGDMTTQFGLVEDRVPDGWTFRLQSVRVERSSERGSGAFDADRTVFAMWAVYEITAPESAIPGPYRFRGTLRARSAGEAPVRLDVELLN